MVAQTRLGEWGRTAIEVTTVAKMEAAENGVPEIYHWGNIAEQTLPKDWQILCAMFARIGHNTGKGQSGSSEYRTGCYSARSSCLQLHALRLNFSL